MNISGSCHIPAGEYNEKIAISGSGKIDGNIRCTTLVCSGSAHGTGNVDCSGDVRVSGSMSINGELTSSVIVVAGAMKIGEKCTAKEQIKIAGSLKSRSVKSGLIICAGKITASEGIEAEDVKVEGGISCAGLLNAEKVEIVTHRDTCEIGSIGGSDIKIYPKDRSYKKVKPRMPLLSKLIGSSGSMATVSESIEGDVIALENVKAPLVVGRIVAIGAGCEIGLVQYSESIEIDPDAKVEKQEKI